MGGGGSASRHKMPHSCPSGSMELRHPRKHQRQRIPSPSLYVGASMPSTWPRPTAQTSCVVQIDPEPMPTRSPSAPASISLRA